MFQTHRGNDLDSTFNHSSYLGEPFIRALDLSYDLK